MSNPFKDLEARMDQAERELTAALEMTERAFNEALPPIYASVSVGDFRETTGLQRLYYGAYVDEVWGLYVRYPDGWVRLAEADRAHKIQASRMVGPLWAAVIQIAEQEIEDIKRATAKVLEFLKAIS